MEIESGDVIKTPYRRLEVLQVTHDTIIVRGIEYRLAGKESYGLQAVITLCINKVWGLEKATKQLDMSALEEL